MRKMEKTQVMTRTLGAKLSSELTEEYNVRSMPVKKGDTIIVMRGAFKGVEGKVTRADHENSLLYVEGVTKEKADGNTIFLGVHPSNVRISKLSLDDKRRKDILERRGTDRIVRGAEKPKTRSRSQISKKAVSILKKGKTRNDT